MWWWSWTMKLSVHQLESGDPSLELYRISNEYLQLVFLPSVGGRLLSLQIAGKELLRINPDFFDRKFRALKPRLSWATLDGTFASWANVGGSKTWPAPQGENAGQWAGPPDPVLDAGEWTFESTWLPIEKVQQVIMASPNDARTGLQVKREFRIPATGSSFFEHTTFTNTSHRNVRWSLWEVCQIDTFAARDGATDSAVEVTVSFNHPPIELARYAGVVRPTIADGIARVPIEPGVAKFGFPHSTGEIKWRGPAGTSLVLKTAVDERAEYPDHGSRIEVWAQSPIPYALSELNGFYPNAWLVELEVLSPLHTIEPGGCARLDIQWSAHTTGTP